MRSAYLRHQVVRGLETCRTFEIGTVFRQSSESKNLAFCWLFRHITITLVDESLLIDWMFESKSGIGEHGFPVDEELQADLDFFMTGDPSLAIVDIIRTSLEALTFEIPSPLEDVACKAFGENKATIVLRVNHNCLYQELWQYIGVEDRKLQEKIFRLDIFIGLRNMVSRLLTTISDFFVQDHLQL